MSATAPAASVLSLPAVRWSIGELEASNVHPFFLAYLFLRRWSAQQGQQREIDVHWDEVGSFLDVPGGPPDKPYFRPLLNGNVEDPGRYWLNSNIAGSYAPSSLRKVPPRVITTNGPRFGLRDDHAALAFEHLLFETQMSGVALAAYLFRNHAFQAQTRDDFVPDGLLVAMSTYFALAEDDLDLWFSASVPALGESWFEPIEATNDGMDD